MRKQVLYRRLVDRYLDRTATVEELQTFFLLLEQGKLQRQLLEATQDVQERSSVKLRRMSLRLAAAAVLLGLIGIGSFWLLAPHRHATPAFVSVLHNDIDPGKDRAILTQPDGSQVSLDRVEDYQRMADSKKTLYRSVATPAGGQYRLTLADGTRVWLNSQSSIRFPTAFKGKTRTVEISGEAYFDVAKDARRPFFVKAGNLTVQALGTQFNIHAYPDEAAAKTTLIQGSVRVVKGTDSLLLVPGQEGESDQPTGLVLNRDVDTAQASAWKDGFFDFDNQDIQSIMRQFARWYDIQIVYAGKPGTSLFAGKMQRSLRLSQVMIGLGTMGVHSRLEGRVLTILP